MSIYNQVNKPVLRRPVESGQYVALVFGQSLRDAKKVLRLIDQLEDNDDVQDVYANFDIPEHVLEAVAG